MQAKDIPADAILAEVRRHNEGKCGGHPPFRMEPHWAFWWDLYAAFPDWPEKVIMAKGRRLIKKGLLSGCPCGCRGDLELPDCPI